MKQYASIIRYLTTAAFLFTVIAGYIVFHEVSSSLLRHQDERFHAESTSRINKLNQRITNISDNFKSYTQLPSFKSIRFYTLTLNRLAVEESTRQLELFFFDMLKNNNYLLEVRFINNDGNEQIKVDRNAIRDNLTNVSKFKDVTHVIDQNIKHNGIHIDVIREKSGVLKSMTWWLPVYVSASKRLGYLAFDVDIALIQNEISDISKPGLIYVVIANKYEDILHSKYELISEPMPDNFRIDDAGWVISDELALSDLDWKIFIIGNKAVTTKDIKTMQSAVNYGLVPASSLILAFMGYLFRKKSEADKQIHHLAYYDSLTGLVNRHQFDKALNIVLEEAREQDTSHALLYLDLDQFKVVNDTCGHLAGDKLLEGLAAHLKLSVRDSDMLARLGGDEFALLLNYCPEEMAMIIANKILTAVSDFQFFWKDKSFTVGVSIGVVIIRHRDESASNVLRKADLACYMAKELGRNRIHVYTDEDQNIEERYGEMQWVARIKQAIDEDLFFLVAQRILDLGDENSPVRRYEVLVRLKENNVVIPPGAFIPAAERYGIMSSIDKWVIDNTFSFMEKLLDSPLDENKNTVFSINVSGLSLGEKSFFPYIKEKLLQYKIPPESICFEITETAAIASISIAMDFMRSVKELGCSLSLDDFGSGLCSFSYLKTIPVDYLKIDGSFVTRMLDNPLDMAIVIAIKQISLATKSKVIAEFVSSTEIKEKLKEIGIDYAQGFGVAEPVPVNSLFKLANVKSVNQLAAKK